MEKGGGGVLPGEEPFLARPAGLAAPLRFGRVPDRGRDRGCQFLNISEGRQPARFSVGDHLRDGTGPVGGHRKSCGLGFGDREAEGLGVRRHDGHVGPGQLLQQFSVAHGGQHFHTIPDPQPGGDAPHPASAR